MYPACPPAPKTPLHRQMQHVQAPSPAVLQLVPVDLHMCPRSPLWSKQPYDFRGETAGVASNPVVKPTLYYVSHCMASPASMREGCNLHSTPVAKPWEDACNEEATTSNTEERELGLLPSSLKEELNLGATNGHVTVYTQLGSGSLASEEPVDCGVEPPDHPLSTHVACHVKGSNSESISRLYCENCMGCNEQKNGMQSVREEYLIRDTQDDAGSSRPTLAKGHLAVGDGVAASQMEPVVNEDCVTSSSLTEPSLSTETHTVAEGRQRDAAVSTEPLPLHCSTLDQIVQTVPIRIAEKCIVTDVLMKDMDCFAEEFVKLKLVQAERKQKNTPTSPEAMQLSAACGREQRCDVQRAVQAELQLLALQHTMCQERCWRCYCTSVDGERLLLGREGMPKSLTETLQKLENDYQEMRRKVLCGVPLNQLCPLSVNWQGVEFEGRYTPAEHQQKADMTTDVPRPAGCQTVSDALHTAIPNAIKTGPALSGLRRNAEETLRYVCEVMQGNADKDVKGLVQGFPNERHAGEKSFVCVRDLANDTTEEEIKLWFEKYDASSVNITSTSVRSAIVIVGSPRNADLAVKELNGCVINGRSIKVEHMDGATRAVPNLLPRAFQEVKPGQHTPVAKSSIPAKPFHHSLERLMNIKKSPSSSGTFVPQHRVSKDSFETLMAQLLERHPEAGRQRIVSALLEVQVKHEGFLSDLPVSTILDMTSALLKCNPEVRG